VNPARLLARLLAGRLANVGFSDLLRLVEALGFELSRVSGSHRVYSHPDVVELLCLQPDRGEAKPYQVRQLLALVQGYNLKLRGKE
jgi:predicted RNA binding protein YcfA (HicA-like mRNA interferase family)